MSCVTYEDEGRDRNTNFYFVYIAQVKDSINYISNIYGGVMESKKKCH